MKTKNAQKKGQKGITLIALVITIIVLLILSGVAIASLGGENGLIAKAKLAKEKYSISESKEKLEFAITELRIEQEGKGENLKKEDLPKINNDEIDVGNTDKFPVEVICGKYVFNVDENFNVAYVREADGTIITYTTEPEGYTNKDKIQILIKVSNPKGIKEIVYPDGDKLEIGGATERGIDYTVTENGKYTFKVVDNENKEIVKDVVIDQIDKLAPIDFTPEVQKNESSITIKENAQDAERDEISTKSGISYCEYYLKLEAQTEYIKYNTNKIDGLAVGKYKLYVIAYDRAGNNKKSSEIEFNISARFKEIKAEGTHNLGIDKEGNLWAWGNNRDGQLGDGTRIDRHSPVQIKPGTKFTQIEGCQYNSFVINKEGNLWGWGDNCYGQLGDGTTMDRNTPVLIKPGTKFTQISAGNDHSLALDEAGNLWAWGRNNVGQLGDGTTTDSYTPKKITTNTKFTLIEAGEMYNLALDEEGKLWAWGFNGNGQLGDGTTTDKHSPVKIKTETKFTQINAGVRHSLAIDKEENIWVWGKNDNGELGDGTTTDKHSPVKIKTETKFTQIKVGQDNNLALDENGNIWAWGFNGNGQLGDGTTAERHIPIQITTGTKFKQIEAGYFHGLAIDEKENLWGWGNNNYGQLGDGTTIERNVPTQINYSLYPL